MQVPVIYNKVSPRGRRDDMPPPADGSSTRKNRGGSMSVTNMLCFTLLYVVALCVKMRCVILCIKRLLID